MTTKQQAKDLVDLNASDEQIARLTECSLSRAWAVRAWGCGDAVQNRPGGKEGAWHELRDDGDYSFTSRWEYRIAPRLIRASAELPDGRTVEVEWPEPVRDALTFGHQYLVVEGDRFVVMQTWGNSEYDYKMLHQGRIHLTREAALQHDRAMRKLNGGEVE